VVPLGHVVSFIEDHLRRYQDVLRSAHFKDPLLALLKLLDKLDMRLVQGPLLNTSLTSARDPRGMLNGGQDLPGGPKARGGTMGVFARAMPWQGRGLIAGTLAVVLLITALLVTVQVRTERGIQRTLGIPSPRLEELGYQLRRAEAQRRAMEQEVATLRDRVDAMRRSAIEGQGALGPLGRELDRLRALAGFTAVRGPGVVVLIADSPRPLWPGEDPNDVLVHYADLQAVVNDLWAAGAEAVAINGERFAAISAIQCVGTTILVNQRRITPPFRIEAIGDAAPMREYVLREDGALAYLRAFAFPISVARSDRLVLPAYRGPLPAAPSSPAR